jgi:glycosyltransferase involved in cell wall biosynthesis
MILYISNYADPTGYSRAAQNYILSMDSVGLKVLPRKISYSQTHIYPQRIKELEQQVFIPEIVIQNVLPHEMEYVSGLKNIGLFFNESDSLGMSSWAEHLNMMDEIWVGSNRTKQACIKSGVNKDIRVIPPPTVPVQAGNLNIKEQTGYEFLFYFIGENIPRKNLETLLRCYYYAFSEEPVGLVIKSGGDIYNFCDNIISKIRKYTKLDQYKRPVIIPDYLSEEHLWALHNSCDCFISCSYGEGFLLPAAEAICAGKPCILPDHVELAGEESWIIPSAMEPCYGAETFPDLNTPYENWGRVQIDKVVDAMREAYQDRLALKKRGLAALKRRSEFSLQSVGELIKSYVS